MQRQYAYRDSHNTVTSVLTAVQELALLAAGSPLVLYTFGTNARAISIYNWPNIGDYAFGTTTPRSQCYGREIMVYAPEDTWIRFISLNPIYITLISQQYTATEIAGYGVSQTILEVEHFLAAGDKDTFNPAFGTAIVFRADSVAGDIYISIEGDVEAGE